MENSDGQSDQIGQDVLAVASQTDRHKSGPRTNLGKQRSKDNALKHGFFSRVVVLKNEPRNEFESLHANLLTDLEPIGMLEEVLVEKLAVILWRYRRLLALEATPPKSTIDLIVENCDGNIHPLGNLRWELTLRYESNLERAFDRTLGQLERLRRIRLGEAVPPEHRARLIVES